MFFFRRLLWSAVKVVVASLVGHAAVALMGAVFA
jgi:hypothetical protein